MKLVPSSLFISVFLAIHTPALAKDKNTSKQTVNEHIEVFGHKISILSKDVASSISSITDKTIQRNQEAELSQILRELPGVELSGSVTPLSSQPSIRGLYGERIHVSIDNVKRKTESDGTSNIAAINSLSLDPSQVKQVLVLRGADSLTVGSGAIGGSIRLVTKDASDYLDSKNGFGARTQILHQSVSDSNSISTSLFNLNDISDTVFHASKVSFSDVDVIPNKSQDTEDDAIEDSAKLTKIKNNASRTNLTLKNTWYFMPEHSLQTKVDWARTQSKDQPYRQDQSYGIRYPTLSEDFNNDYIELMSNYVYQPDNDLIDFDLQLVYSDKNYEKNTLGYILKGENKSDFTNLSKGSTERYNIRLANLSQFSGIVDHQLAIEVNYENEKFKQSDASSSEISTFYGDSKSQNLSFSVIDQANFFNEQVLVTAGLRFDTFKRSNSTYTNYDNNKDGELSNELGLTFKASDNINIYIKYAEAFRAPSVQELYKKDDWRCHIGGKICYQEPQPDLKPETSQNLETGLGLFWQDISFADNLAFKLIHFNNKIDNFIDNVPFMYYLNENGAKQQGSPGPKPVNGIPVATHRDYSAKNIGRLESIGWEAELSYTFEKFDAYLGYSKIDMNAYGMPNFFLGSIDHNKQPYTEAPANKISLNLNYQLFESLNLSAQMLNYSEQQRLPENYLNAGYGTSRYTVYNLNASYNARDFLSGLKVNIGVDNLTNERYLRAPASEASDPSELGRNYKVTLAYQF
ncbi:TonB-dependent receptor domain-containing protein [Pseudoalteromonas denitrificans]|uniref:TonB-dependent heme/hemoglobin receptor family protein n=1 Tax=Pseudoalteromonas denitrificans DSM 6059 TaxID=1123010 RepID=A0A1I1NJT9_9GAMM|nr:TonB-dependent receptor [Pseudoalteromonas denitrificans]SFC97745.1 TonB-dependent heme/hemoglobin receptor family protein [Pseudoalteromonas denitrificans DSM 6059]